MNPPKDGSVIIADFNIIEHDDWSTSVIGVQGKRIHWDGELWVYDEPWPIRGMSVITCLGDEIFFHWWTAAN